MARTMILPAAVRYLSELLASEQESMVEELSPVVTALHEAIVALEKANEDPGLHGIDLAKYMKDTVFTAMSDVRTESDKLEELVADDLWPLPKYSEMLFIK